MLQQLKDEIAEVTAEMESMDNGEERYFFLCEYFHLICISLACGAFN